MKASPEMQLKLLDLQAMDATLTRIAVRRRTLPALSVIAEATAEIAQLQDTLVGHETEVSDHARAAAKLENEIEQVRARSSRDRERLDTGSVGSAKELESLQHEIASLGRRQAALEDDELEILELREQAERAAAQVSAASAEASERLASAEAERDREFAAFDAEVAAVTADRSALAPQLPPELLALYDRLRADPAGIGAAALVRRRCEACHLELAGSELSAVRTAAADEVLRHEDCGRILVRTAESGL